jgi:carbon-monoxide dehydrogenase small subunit/xanthine dehydrogenase small subunit
MTSLKSPPATVRFALNSAEVAITTAGGRRLLDVLRRDLGLTGTKEGCGEGECGACAVLVDGELVNSCLVPVGQMDGHEIVTVEGLAGDGPLSPLQQSFHEIGGAQCGLCTPGMLLAAHALLVSGRPAGDRDIREAIAGNLCRCTGYTKIIEAVEAVAGDEEAAAALPAAAAVAVGGSSPVVATGSSTAGPELVRPTSLRDALERLAARPELLPVAGGTDIMVAFADGRAGLRPMLDLGGLDELRDIEIRHDELVIGALVTWEELRRSALVHSALPVLAEVAAVFGAVAIRNRGTVGGSCVTASPAGDLLPVLLVTDALLEAAGPGGRRLIPAAEFWTGYRETALEAGELLAAVHIPLVPDRQVRFRKIGTRRALAIAKVLVAVAWRPDEASDGQAAWHDVRVALGSVAARPIRAPRTEAALEGLVPDAAVAHVAARTVMDEISPIDDVRSTAAYRRAVTGRVLRRMLVDATS